MPLLLPKPAKHVPQPVLSAQMPHTAPSVYKIKHIWIIITHAFSIVQQDTMEMTVQAFANSVKLSVIPVVEILEIA